MRKTILAKPKTFVGTPKITTPAIYGASPNKPFMIRINVLGERPLKISASGLPDGVKLNKGIISGAIAEEGNYKISVKVSNGQGQDEKVIKIKIKEGNVCLTPLMGWTSWNAFREDVSQKNVLATANAVVDSGLSEYGYTYINIDAGWQGDNYGGDYYAIEPNKKFPKMKTLCDDIHKLGLKCGIYSAPMLYSYPVGKLIACTRGKKDANFPKSDYGIGLEHYEMNNAFQWADWGFDYLKYDYAPTETYHCDMMKKCLAMTSRDFAYSLTTRAKYADREYWRNNVSSWRDNCDSEDRWENLVGNWEESDKWLGIGKEGHFFDLDMLETGYMASGRCHLSEDEQIASFTARVIFPTPIQLSCDLTKLSEFDKAVFCNEEVIAVNQDPLSEGAKLTFNFVSKRNGKNEKLRVYEKPLEDGDIAVAVFNLGDEDEDCAICCENLRDLWAKKNIKVKEDKYEFTAFSHTVRLFKVKNKKDFYLK